MVKEIKTRIAVWKICRWIRSGGKKNVEHFDRVAHLMSMGFKCDIDDPDCEKSMCIDVDSNPEAFPLCLDFSKVKKEDFNKFIYTSIFEYGRMYDNKKKQRAVLSYNGNDLYRC